MAVDWGMRPIREPAHFQHIGQGPRCKRKLSNWSDRVAMVYADALNTLHTWSCVRSLHGRHTRSISRDAATALSSPAIGDVALAFGGMLTPSRKVRTTDAVKDFPKDFSLQVSFPLSMN